MPQPRRRQGASVCFCGADWMRHGAGHRLLLESYLATLIQSLMVACPRIPSLHGMPQDAGLELLAWSGLELYASGEEPIVGEGARMGR